MYPFNPRQVYYKDPSPKKSPNSSSSFRRFCPRPAIDSLFQKTPNDPNDVFNHAVHRYQPTSVQATAPLHSDFLATRPGLPKRHSVAHPVLQRHLAPTTPRAVCTRAVRHPRARPGCRRRSTDVPSSGRMRRRPLGDLRWSLGWRCGCCTGAVLGRGEEAALEDCGRGGEAEVVKQRGGVAMCVYETRLNDYIIITNI